MEKIARQTLGEYMADPVFQLIRMNGATFRGHTLPHVRSERIVHTHGRLTKIWTRHTGEIMNGPELFAT